LATEIALALRPESGRAVETVWIDAPGARLHAWHVTPSTEPPWPTVVLSHGWGAVKEMNLDYFAAAFADAGLASVVFDHRGFGASEGPRWDVDPAAQVADYGAVLSWAEGRQGTDRDRLAIWGTSFSGGHVLEVAAAEERVRATVAQVPTISGSENTRRRHDDASMAALRKRFAVEREALDRGESPSYVPVVPADRDLGSEPDLAHWEAAPPETLPDSSTAEYEDAEQAQFYGEMPEERRRTWRNRVTLRSIERYAEYEPGRSMAAAASRPLLVIVAADDTITPTDLTLETVRATGPGVEVESVPGGHYNVYSTFREQLASRAARFFSENLPQ
jgi:hypothetical protein